MTTYHNVFLLHIAHFIFTSSGNCCGQTNCALLTAMRHICGIGGGICKAFGFTGMKKFLSIEKSKNDCDNNNINIIDENNICRNIYCCNTICNIWLLVQQNKGSDPENSKAYQTKKIFSKIGCRTNNNGNTNNSLIKANTR